MMSMPTSYFIVLFLASWLLSILYWRIVQPVLLRGIRFRLFARRDRLRRLAIDGKENFKSYSYSEAESFICKSVALVPSLSLLHFLKFLATRRTNNEEGVSLERLRKEGSPAIQALISETAFDAL